MLLVADEGSHVRILDEGQHAAATVTLLAVVGKLAEVGVGVGLDQFAWRLVDAAHPADVAAVVPGDLDLLLAVDAGLPALRRVGLHRLRDAPLAGRDLLGQHLAVVSGRDAVVDAELLGPLRIGVAPHHVAGRAARDDGVGAGRLHVGDVGPHHLDELVPLAGHQHRRGAAELLAAEVGEVHAGLVEDAY